MLTVGDLLRFLEGIEPRLPVLLPAYERGLDYLCEISVAQVGALAPFEGGLGVAPAEGLEAFEGRFTVIERVAGRGTFLAVVLGKER